LKDPKSDPKEWERYFKDIVRLHYRPANYRDVPDKHIGDFGIECYSLNGHVFQCYLPEQTSDIKKLVKAQKEKIRKDIEKLAVKNILPLIKLFGDVKISRWILATSCNESAELAQYCAEKSLEVRHHNIPYISKDFQILVHTEQDYPQEVLALRRDFYQLEIGFDNISIEKAGDWISSNSSFLSKLSLKIPKITSSEVDINNRSRFIVQKYLEYENLLETLKTEWTDIYEVIYSCIRVREENLAGRFLVSNELLPTGIIKEEIEKLNNDIAGNVKTLKGSDLEIITWGVISDWLIRCPLDF